MRLIRLPMGMLAGFAVNTTQIGTFVLLADGDFPSCS